MKIKTLYTPLLSAFAALLLNPFMHARAQPDAGFMYGKVTTIDNSSYTGAIRWGKEEVFWFDMFNSSKPRNRNLRYLSAEDRDNLNRSTEKWSSRRSNVVIKRNRSWNNKHTHSFTCQFGNILSLEITGRDRVALRMKNGEMLELEGGSNDIGTKIKVYDDELGVVELKWDRVERVEFMDTPKKLNNKFGEPLYGNVETAYGDFTGFVQWDHDERLSTDKLDGDNMDGNMAIELGKIKSVERDGRGSLVILKSGRDFYLTGSNDVNHENRGIIVNMPGQGRVDIEWRDFRMVTFTDSPKDAGPSYASYKMPGELSGKVKTESGSTLSGRIIYDLDEAYDFEILQGKEDDLSYLIPFGEIKSIIPKNYSYTRVELKNGKKLLLTDSQDVTEDNDGILVFTGEEDPTYIPWDDVDEIIFD